jgi:CubicO group peptidase (beta-lactamase class C family)
MMSPLILAALSAAWARVAANDVWTAEDLSALLARAMEASDVPAMGILVIRDRKVDAKAVRGVRRNDGADPVDLDDPWRIGSNGKTMTAAMVARLVDRGVLSWSQPLEAMLPELAATMHPQYRNATLVQLLSHHTGMPHDVGDARAPEAFLPEHGPVSLPQARLTYIGQALQEAPIGPTTAFNYSNTGYLIAAVIAERAAGESYEALMRREVFEPLGMSRVGFGLTQQGQPVGHISGRPAGPADANPAFFAPAGDMFMPLEDWARFCIDQLEGARGGGELLEPETYRLMQTAQPGGPSGLGWGVTDTVAGRQGPALMYSGSDGSWTAMVVLLPNSGSGVLVTANAGDGMGGEAADKAALKAILMALSPPATSFEIPPR